MASVSVSNDLKETYAAARPQSLAWYARAGNVLAGKVGHDLRNFEPVPMYITRGQGGRKWDVDGNEYVDFLMGNGALLLGHADPEVVEAIRAAAALGTHFGNDHPQQIVWAEQIQSLVPSADRVRFVNSGTEATALAFRLARAFTGQSRILRFEGHFHGWHDDVVHGFQPPFDAEGSCGIPASIRENLAMLPDGDIEQVERLLTGENRFAAVIIEPSGASWGRVPIDVEFLRKLREVTARLGVLLVFDEVITGFRFSPGGAQELYGVLPDLTCLAKIMAGGMPGGAVAGRADVMALFDQTGQWQHDRFERVTHFGTFNASPLSAAAGLVVLKRIASGEAIARADARAVQLRAAWDEVLARHDIAGYVYGPASTFHVYFETDAERIQTATERNDLQTSDPAQLKGMPGGLITAYQRSLRFHGVDIMSSTGGVLSAAHTEQDIEDATAAFEQTIQFLLREQLICRL